MRTAARDRRPRPSAAVRAHWGAAYGGGAAARGAVRSVLNSTRVLLTTVVALRISLAAAAFVVMLSAASGLANNLATLLSAPGMVLIARLLGQGRPALAARIVHDYRCFALAAGACFALVACLAKVRRRRRPLYSLVLPQFPPSAASHRESRRPAPPRPAATRRDARRAGTRQDFLLEVFASDAERAGLREAAEPLWALVVLFQPSRVLTAVYGTPPLPRFRAAPRRAGAGGLRGRRGAVPLR